MKTTEAIFIGLILMLSITSCHKVTPAITAPTTNGVYITNEGDFNSGQGEVSFYNPASGQISNNLFYAVNNYHLGDIAQSMYIKDSTGFIVVNNSAKVEVVKIPSLKHVLTINIPNSSPRYFLPVNDSMAYVTDLYASAVHVINYHTGALIGNINGVAKWTEHMVMVNGIAVIEERSQDNTPSNTGSIISINTTTNSILQRYSFNGSNVDGLVSDNNNRVWFGMDADTVHQIPASIYCLNSDLSLYKNIPLQTGHTASNLKINGAGTEIYYLDNYGVGAISVNDTVASTAPFIPVSGRNLYGLGIDPTNGNVYVSDALDYVQPSRIYLYDMSGSLIQSFTAGVISGNFAFTY